MKLEEKYITAIREKWSAMLTKEDFLDLLNFTKPLIFGEKCKPFELKQITWYSNPKINSHRYLQFSIKKKSGGSRTIHAPVRGLMAIQKTLSVILQCMFEPHKAAMGFVQGKSVVDNARIHVGQNYVYNIDLKDFFPSITQARVWKCLQLPPFNLIGENRHNEATKVIKLYDPFKVIKEDKVIKFKLIKTRKGIFVHFINEAEQYISIRVGKNVKLPDVIAKEQLKYLLNNCSVYQGNSRHGDWFSFGPKSDLSEIAKEQSGQNIVNLIASLCCTELEAKQQDQKNESTASIRYALPQGAPTSPVITNVICQKLDFLLTGVAKRFGLKYSRYADDITFSSMHNVYQPGSEFSKELHRIIAEQGFTIKESKTRLQKDGYRKEVTGLLVNSKVNVQKRYVKQLRMWLYYWERYGYQRAYDFFLKQYKAEKGHVKNETLDMTNVIKGKLDYLKMVKGNENELFSNLKSRFAKLSGVKAPLDALLEIWESEGIEKAMNRYYSDNNF